MRQRQDKDSAPLCHTLDITRQEKTKQKKKSHSKSQRGKEERWEAGGKIFLQQFLRT